jgi:hypothetical protein
MSTTILHVFSSITGTSGPILWLHEVSILNILKLYVRYLLNILCPYYKFIQAILLYFPK